MNYINILQFNNLKKCRHLTFHSNLSKQAYTVEYLFFSNAKRELVTTKNSIQIIY